jgi:CheY-like chemotaxis protein
MDLHMPVMNGYEASSVIRTLYPDVPIVAMTADAITGVDEECRRVGIDHYISKPFDPQKLMETLLHILDEEPPKQAEFEILDAEDGLKRIGEKADLYRMILKEYKKEFLDINEQMEQAIDVRDYTEAIKIVHKCKGGSANIGAKKLASIAAILQKALAEGPEGFGAADAAVQELCDAFCSAVNKLFAEIDEYLA